MAKQTSFAHQKQVLTQFSSLLSGFENDLNNVVQRYEQGIFSLYEDQGLMEEIYEDYKNVYLDTAKAAILDLVSRVREEDILFIEKEIDFISSR